MRSRRSKRKKYVTIRDLRDWDACMSQRELFLKLWPSGKAKLTLENVVLASRNDMGLGLTAAMLMDREHSIMYRRAENRSAFSRCDAMAKAWLLVNRARTHESRIKAETNYYTLVLPKINERHDLRRARAFWRVWLKWRES